MFHLNLKFSVIVPTKNAEDTIEDCLRSLLVNEGLEEVIVVDDSTDKTKEIVSKYPVKLIDVPVMKVSEKCNQGIKYSSGDFIGFTDQDCMIPSDWVERARYHILKTGAHALGGPNLTPAEVGFRQRCSGRILSSWFGTGPSVYRYKGSSNAEKVVEADESKLISCNLFINKKALLESGKFDVRLYSCEENELLYRMKEKGFKLYYASNLHVWHHRRPILEPLIRGIFWYANGRGCLIRKKPKSFKLFHILPSAFVLGLLLGPLITVFNPILKMLYLSVVGLYFILNVLTSAKDASSMKEGVKAFPILVASYFLVHFTYGLALLYGLSGRWYKYKRIT